MCDSGSSFGASWWTLGTFSAPVARPEPIATGSPMNFTCSDLQRVSFERRSPARDLHVSGVDPPPPGWECKYSPMAEEHECRCATLPLEWGRCGQATQAVWATGCDGTMQDRAREHLGFQTRVDFIEWAASQLPGQFRVS